MGIGPAPAIRAALAKAGMTLDDVTLFEINEAFAGQILAVLRSSSSTRPSSTSTAAPWRSATRSAPPARAWC